MRHGAAILVLGMSAGALTVAAEARTAAVSPQAALEKMQSAQRHLDYQGVFVYQNGAQWRTFALTHAWFGGRSHERLIALNGDSGEVLVDGSAIYSVLPARKTVLVMQRGAALKAPGPGRAALWNNPYYKARWDGWRRVAGVRCHRIELKPVDDWRYPRAVCIDPRNDLPLESEVDSNAGQVIERVQFATLRLLPKVSRRLFSPPGAQAGYALKHVYYAAAPARPQWRFTRLPPGFALRRELQRKMDGMQRAVRQFVISDGLSTLSVFIAPRRANDPRRQFLRDGALNVYATVKQGAAVTLLGEVPRRTLLAVARGLTRVGAGGG